MKNSCKLGLRPKFASNALTVAVGWQEEYQACKETDCWYARESDLTGARCKRFVLIESAGLVWLVAA